MPVPAPLPTAAPPVTYASIATPLILGTASLIAFVSVRNTSIADRVRAANLQVIDPKTPAGRRKNLVEGQILGLCHRYISSTYALLVLLFSFVAFVVMGALDARARAGATTAFGCGVVLGGAGFILTLYEVFTSRQTLDADTAYATAVYEETLRPSAETPPSP